MFPPRETGSEPRVSERVYFEKLNSTPPLHHLGLDLEFLEVSEDIGRDGREDVGSSCPPQLLQLLEGLEPLLILRVPPVSGGLDRDLA